VGGRCESKSCYFFFVFFVLFFVLFFFFQYREPSFSRQTAILFFVSVIEALSLRKLWAPHRRVCPVLGGRAGVENAQLTVKHEVCELDSSLRGRGRSRYPELVRGRGRSRYPELVQSLEISIVCFLK